MPRSRLHLNVLSNLSANVWLAFVTFLAIPVIYRALGPTQYAIVGMYLLIIQWSAFLDLGLSPALGRFAAQQNRADGSFAKVRYLLSSFELMNLVLGLLLLLGGLLLYYYAPKLLQTGSGLGEVPFVFFMLILLVLVLRVIANLYRAALTGVELQAQVSLINSIVVSLRMGLPILFALAGQLSLMGFFFVQVAAGCLESFWFRSRLLSALGSRREPVSREDVKKQILFGVSIAGLGVLWIASLQVDKLVLSGSLSLEDFGSYVLAVQLASAVTLMTIPIQTAVLPRLTGLLASGKEIWAAELYTLSCLVCMVIGVASTFAILVCGESLLVLIGGTKSGPRELDVIVAMYAFSNSLVAILGLAYALQNASGTLRWHWMGTIILTTIQIPLLYMLAQHGDVLLLVAVYMLTIFAYILVWLPLPHSRFLSISHWHWLRRTMLQPLLVTIPLGGSCVVIFASYTGQLEKLSQGVFTFLFVLVCGACSTRQTRGYITEFVRPNA